MDQIKAVLFDMYGTLVDIKTDEHCEDAFESLSRFLEYRRMFISGRELKELYFAQINQQFAKSRENHPEIDVALAFENVLNQYGMNSNRYLAMITTQLYRSLTRERLKLFNDTFWTLNKFRKKYRLGIISDAQRLFCKPELRSLRVEKFFDVIVISSDFGFRKPDPRLFNIALTIFNLKPSEAAYIGNNFETDAVGAKVAGFGLVGLIHQSEEDKLNYDIDFLPDFIASNLGEAFDMVTGKIEYQT